jgi:hypothetical protein
MRIVEPLLPQSSVAEGALKTPGLLTSKSFPSSSITTPSCRKHEIVAVQSSLVEKLRSLDIPAASAARMAARCEIDLSPGMRRRPRTLFAGFILTI